MATTAVDRHRSTLKQHLWQRQMCLDTEEGGVIVDVCKTLNLSRTIRTPKSKGRYGEQEVVYFIEGDDREFTSIEEVVQALEDKGILNA